MRYVYRCDPCQAAAPERTTEPDAATDRDRHRAIAHHGLIPADRIDEIPGPLAVAGRSLLHSALAMLIEGGQRAGKSKALREVRATEYWQQAVRLLGIGVGVLVLAGLIGRHFF